MSSGMNVIEIEMGVMDEVDADLRSRIFSANAGERVSSVPSIFFVRRDGTVLPYNSTTISEQDYASSKEIDRPRSSAHMLRFARNHDLLHGRRAAGLGATPSTASGSGRGQRRGQAARKVPVVSPPRRGSSRAVAPVSVSGRRR